MDLTACDLYNQAKNPLTLGLSSSLEANFLEAIDLLNQAVSEPRRFSRRSASSLTVMVSFISSASIIRQHD
jgi:hypothetical protein